MQQALHRSSLVPRGFVVESACYEGDEAVITVRMSGLTLPAFTEPRVGERLE